MYLNTRLILTPEFRWSNLTYSMVNSTGWPPKNHTSPSRKHNECSPELWDPFKKKKLVFYNAITIDFCRGTFVHTFSGGFSPHFSRVSTRLLTSQFLPCNFLRVNFEGLNMLIYKHPIGSVYHLYIANWVIICYLPPLKGTRNNNWLNTVYTT